jgi:hypothetical protein
MATRQSAESKLAQLTAQGADRFDPVRFCYIAALIRRSAEKQARVRHRLEDRALEALSDYQKQFEAVRQEDFRQTASIADPHADQTGMPDSGFDKCEFLAGRHLDQGGNGKEEKSALAVLADLIGRAGRLADDNAARVSVDALLKQHEKEIVATLGRSSPDAHTGSRPAPNDRLRALYFFRENEAVRHCTDLVSQALGHVPENPGHLNSQMLVTRCLEAMKRISVAYLQRWVSQMETLLWLETAEYRKDQP